MSGEEMKPLINSLKGEVPVQIGGDWYVMRFSLGAIREIKEHFQIASLEDLGNTERVWTEEDITAMLLAGLRRGSFQGKDVSMAEVEELLNFHEIGQYGKAIQKAMNLATSGKADPRGPSSEGLANPGKGEPQKEAPFS
jgi:hypothetical protein